VTYRQRMARPERRPYRPPSMFPWWLWIAAPLAVIAVVAIALLVA